MMLITRVSTGEGEAEGDGLDSEDEEQADTTRASPTRAEVTRSGRETRVASRILTRRRYRSRKPLASNLSNRYRPVTITVLIRAV
jgi:hypothetical protein